MDLKQEQQGDSQDKIMTADNQLTMQKCNELLQELSERLTTMEQRISSLEKPRLMYRPPLAKDHQTIAETLDYLHNSIEALKDDSSIH